MTIKQKADFIVNGKCDDVLTLINLFLCILLIVTTIVKNALVKMCIPSQLAPLTYTIRDDVSVSGEVISSWHSV